MTATGYKSIFIDTSPFIYYIEKDVNNPLYSDAVKHFLSEAFAYDTRLITSTITVEEYMVWPYRSGRVEYGNLFQSLLIALSIEVVPITTQIAHRAAQIRAKYKTFKAMDALQLAVATQLKCEAFLTNDKRLSQFDDVSCLIVDDLAIEGGTL